MPPDPGYDLARDAGDRLLVQLGRIADALERIAPPPRSPPSFAEAHMFRYLATSDVFSPAPDFRLPLELLLGIEPQKTRFCENLSRFAEALPYNNVLLWGARGTGKSSLVKAAFMSRARQDARLKLIEADRDDLGSLPTLFAVLRERGERFVVMCDDLSFEEGAGAAKSLKSALEGGVAGAPDNVMFVATSNRRHLMPRSHEEAGGLLSAAEDAEESVSASDRFGLWLGFSPMDQSGYLATVLAYARRFALDSPDIERRALQWAQLRGGRSGRVAYQFARELAGELGRPLPV